MKEEKQDNNNWVDQMINLYKMLLMLCTWIGSVFTQDEQLTEQFEDSVIFAIALPFVNCQTFDCPSMHLEALRQRGSHFHFPIIFLFLYHGHKSEPDLILNCPDRTPSLLLFPEHVTEVNNVTF